MLKPCPFCGSPDIKELNYTLVDNLYKLEIYCSNCGVKMDIDYTDTNKEIKYNELYNKWNTRYDSKYTKRLCNILNVKPFQQFKIKANKYIDEYDAYMKYCIESYIYRIGTKGIESYYSAKNKWGEDYFDINNYHVIKKE